MREIKTLDDHVIAAVQVETRSARAGRTDDLRAANGLRGDENRLRGRARTRDADVARAGVNAVGEDDLVAGIRGVDARDQIRERADVEDSGVQLSFQQEKGRQEQRREKEFLNANAMKNLLNLKAL